MDYRQLARSVAAGRIVVGTIAILTPGLMGRPWIGDAAGRPEVKVLARAFGVRDLALGAGALRALDSGEPTRTWVLMGALSDLVDAAATAVAFRRLGARRALPVLALATLSATTGALAADRLD